VILEAKIPYLIHIVYTQRARLEKLCVDHAFDFSMAFGKFKRVLTSFASSFIVFSYLHHCEMYAITFDKLLRAWTISKSRT